MYISKTHMKTLNSMSYSTFYGDCSIRVYRSFHYTCMKIMLGTYYSIDIMFNALPSLKVNCVSLQITHSFIKCMRVSNDCNTDFRLFIDTWRRI